MRNKEKLLKYLNLNVVDLINKTTLEGELDYPFIKCDYTILPDYLALYTEPSKYHLTERTAICFYVYDDKFDGKNGLFNAIYYNDIENLEKFKKRFQGCKYFIMPDCTVSWNLYNVENNYRRFRAMVISLWLTMELNAIVIPNLVYGNDYSFDHSLDGFVNSEVVAVSTKGNMKNNDDLLSLKKLIKYTVDSMPNLKVIVVYTSCGCDEKTLNVFSYATLHGIKICIPDNTLLSRNRRRYYGNK